MKQFTGFSKQPKIYEVLYYFLTVYIYCQANNTEKNSEILERTYIVNF